MAAHLGALITSKLAYDARLVEQLHQVNLDQPHEHQAFLDERQLLRCFLHGRSSLAPIIGRYLTADEPHQKSKEKKRQGQIEIDDQAKGKQQKELDWLAEDHCQPGIQTVVDRLQFPREDAHGFAWPQS